jgi:peptide deformylase
VDAEVKRLAREMLDLMYERDGIGLAANQVDLPYRLFVLNVVGDRAAVEHEHVFINPVIAKRNGRVEAEEGCLSFPGIFAPVERAEKITIAAYSLTGEEVHLELTGLIARAAQHECDHLDGVLFIDRLTESNLLTIKKPLAELELEFQGNRARGLIPDDAQIAARLAELESLRT